MANITVSRPRYPGMFGGLGFQNNEAILYPTIEKEHFDQVLCKCYREISPGFCRTFAGYDNWSQYSMDAFADYYERMQKVTDTPMYLAAAKGALHFSDEEMWQYCKDIAKNLAYLINEKGMKHIRYYCFSNEMSQCGWGDLMDDLPLFGKYHQMLYRAFQNEKLNIGLLATDASEFSNWNTIDWCLDNINRITEDYCLHIYEREHDIYNLDYFDFFYDKCKEVVDKVSCRDGKRFIVGEYRIQKGAGQLRYRKGLVIDVNRYFEDDFERRYCALMLTEMTFAAINAGVYAMALWSYTDYPDPFSCAYSNDGGYAEGWSKVEKYISGTTDVKYNKFGLFKWEDNGDHSAKEPYYCLGLVYKYFKNHSKVLDIACEDKLLRIASVQNRDGSVTVGVVNRHKEPTKVSLRIDTETIDKPFRVYEYDPYHVVTNRFADLPDAVTEIELKNGVLEVTLKPESVTIFTNDYLIKTTSVEAENVGIVDGVISWEHVSDENHCYYRVYASDTPNFVPSKDNQIASTVAETLTMEGGADESQFYRVLSVDKSGNV